MPGRIVKNIAEQALQPGTNGGDDNCGHGGQQAKRTETTPPEIPHGRWEEGLVRDGRAPSATNVEFVQSEDTAFAIEEGGEGLTKAVCLERDWDRSHSDRGCIGNRHLGCHNGDLSQISSWYY